MKLRTTGAPDPPPRWCWRSGWSPRSTWPFQDLAASSLHPSVSGTAWIVDSYTLVFACLLIPAGALGDRFGRKHGMLAGLGLFAAGSVLAALAPSVAVLMCGRAITGVGAAIVLPATLAVALGRVAPAQRPRTVALWSGPPPCRTRPRTATPWTAAERCC